MTNKLKLALVVAFFASCGLFGWTVTAQRQNPTRTAWEYKLLYKADESGVSAERMLNEMGAQGWELIYFRPRNEFAGGDYYFKRAK